MEQAEALEGPGHAGVVDAALVARALALLDRGLTADARALLAGALDDGAAAPGGEPEARAAAEAAFVRLHDTELESAFDDAHPETDAMIDADGIAFEAILRARLDEPESVPLPSPDSPFHTRTMADLLERQGDLESAHVIRSALGAAPALASADPARDVDAAARARTIQTLERWLARLRGGNA
ncbi:MAG: hypothetical protein OZ948_02995 [Deltaproteobacteria bacterium]|nr:hypothetical protein [Deltaproteobacteria bacterium]